MNKSELKAIFINAKAIDAKYIGVSIQTEDSSQPEIIINPNPNFDAKFDYYMEAYDDDLILIAANCVVVDDILCKFPFVVQIITDIPVCNHLSQFSESRCNIASHPAHLIGCRNISNNRRFGYNLHVMHVQICNYRSAVS